MSETGTHYSVYLVLDDLVSEPKPEGRHVDIAVKLGDRVVEMDWDEFVRRVGLKDEETEG